MTTLGKYELHEQLGHGGFGTVYRATDTTLMREVALKVLHPQLTTDPDFLERFRNEARLVASMDSPNITTIYELGESEGRVYIAMKYLSGGSLKSRLEKQGAMPYMDIVEIMQQVCTGLAVAHKMGLVHRDIKPGNILFDNEGRAVLGDFGLARAIQLSSASAASSTAGVGTPAYRAPELWRGKPPASAATDIYSLGCVLFEMVTGKVLFDGSTPDEVITQHLVDGPVFPTNFSLSVPPDIRKIIEKALAKDPRERYQKVSEFEKAIKTLIQEPEVKQTFTGQRESESKRSMEAVQTNKVFNNPLPAPTTDQKKRKRNPNNLWLGVVGVIITGLMIVLIITTKKRYIAMVPLEAPTNTEIPVVTVVSQPKVTNTPVANDLSIPEIGSFKISPKDGMKLMFVPAGDFWMGSPDGVGEINEHPRHKVYLDAYWIDQTEVTNSMYQKCVNGGGCTQPNNSSKNRNSYYNKANYEDYPVVWVNWYQAQAYCQWVGRLLPTEAQWEKAARGVDGNTYPWGNKLPDNTLLNLDSFIGNISPVGSYPKGDSPYDVSDMGGNAWEWVADWYDKNYYTNIALVNPSGPTTGGYRSVRGGAWDINVKQYRSASRVWYSPSESLYNIGFRCYLSANETP